MFSNVEHAAAELRAVLPAALVKEVDWASLALCAGSHVDAILAESHSDLLFSARIAGKPALVYVLFEHQSSADDLMPLRLIKYIVRVLEWHVTNAQSSERPRLPLPLVVPVVLHHSERGWNVARRLEDLFDPDHVRLVETSQLVPRLSFVLDDISHLSDEALRDRAIDLVLSASIS